MAGGQTAENKIAFKQGAKKMELNKKKMTAAIYNHLPTRNNGCL